MKIGIYDSGKGAEEVCKVLRKHFTEVEWMIYADHAFFPYGLLQERVLVERADYCIAQLVERGADIVIVACHTISLIALSKVRNFFNVPLLGVTLPILHAMRGKHFDTLYWCATDASLHSGKIEKHLASFEISSHFVPLFAQRWVSAIEMGQQATENLKLIEDVLGQIAPSESGQKRALVLGCTHFSFWKCIIEERLKSKACEVIDPAYALIQALRPLVD